MKLAIQIVLWVIIGFLGFKTFQSIYKPYQFEKIKVTRYAPVVKQLKNIRDAEMAYKQITGSFTGDFDSLVQFVDTAIYTLTQRRDSTILDKARTKAFGVDHYMEITLIDTLGYASVKDSLFDNSDVYKTMMYVPGTNKEEKISLEAGHIMRNKMPIPVFEAKVAKKVVLKDQPPHLVMQEEQVVSVDAIDGKYITVGSMHSVNTKGNWPKFYGEAKKQ